MGKGKGKAVRLPPREVNFTWWILFSFTFHLLTYKMTSWTED